MMWFIILLVLLYLLMIMPSLAAKNKMKIFLNTYYAHRGFHDNNSAAVENSLGAFEAAIKHQYGIELDVQITKDKQVVVFHDYNLKRICGIDKEVNECTYEELKHYRLLSSKETIPLFTDVLKLVNGQVPLIVEIKKRNGADPICEYAARILDNYPGLYCVESFHPLAVLWFKNNRKQIARGQLSMNFNRDSQQKPSLIYVALRFLLFNFLTKPHFIAYDYRSCTNISKNIARYLFKCPSIAWTIDAKEVYQKTQSYYDGFIFEGFEIDKDL